MLRISTISRITLSVAAFFVIGQSSADAGQRHVRRHVPQQKTWSFWDMFSTAGNYGIDYVPTPGVPLSGAYASGYCALFNGAVTNFRYDEEMYPWEAVQCLDYIVPYMGTLMGYAYKRNLKKVCAGGPASFAYSFRHDSPYILDRPAGAHALNAYYSICGAQKAVSHSTLPPKGYKYPSYPLDWSYVSPY